MNSDRATQDRWVLQKALEALAKQAGVQSPDLIGALSTKGRLSVLRDYWEIDTTKGLQFARGMVVLNLREHIRKLKPRKARQALSLEQRQLQYKNAVEISFNIGENPLLSGKNLEGRRLWFDNEGVEWLVKNRQRHLIIDEHTCRRDLEDAIDQIVDQILGPGYEPVRVDNESEYAEQAAIGTSIEANSLAQPTQRSRHPLAHLVELSGEAERALTIARDACEARGRAFYTFDVLLALLDMPTGRTRSCFEEAASGLSSRVRPGLLAMPDPEKEVHPFTPHKWNEFSWMQVASDYALDDEQLIVTDMHLLLAILDDESGTNRWLRRYIPQEHALVRAVAEGKRREGPTVINSPTPG